MALIIKQTTFEERYGKSKAITRKKTRSGKYNRLSKNLGR